MSKLNKFIDDPRLFFKDAFKKREARIINRLDSVNQCLKKVGIIFQLDLQVVEQSFINTATILTHDNKLSFKIIKLLNSNRGFENKINYSDPLHGLSPEAKAIYQQLKNNKARVGQWR